MSAIMGFPAASVRHLPLGGVATRAEGPGEEVAGGAAMSRIRERSATSASSVSGPSIGLLLSEPVRGLTGFAAMPLAAGWLSSAPRGDGHCVLVLPGLLASDASTVVLRRVVRLLGYRAV